MSVIHIVRGNYAPTALNGVYNVIHNISVNNGKKGVKTLVCSISRHISGEVFVCEEYEHIQFPEHKLMFFLDNGFKKFLLSQSRDTVIHLHSVFIPWFLYTVRFLRGNGFNNIVLTPHGQYADRAMNPSLKKRLFFKFFDKQVIRNVDAVQIIGRSEANGFIKSNARKYVLIPNGCNISEEYKKHEVYDNKSDLIFGYMGRLVTLQKGLDILLKAYAFYRRQGGRGLLQIAGCGTDENYLKELSVQLCINETVRFVGTKIGAEKQAFLLNCSFFVHTSRWDGIPTGCMEAASYGIPLIVSNETNLDTYVKGYDAGLCVSISKHPVQGIASEFFKAERIFYDKDEYEKVSKNAKKMVETELNWTHIAQRIMKELYNTPTTF